MAFFFIVVFDKTGELSEKTKRGKHTTREVRLLPLPGGGFVADTPGFGRIVLTELEPERLKEFFPEFARYEGMCEFADCSHIFEPNCAVKEAVERGEIDPVRYELYKSLYFEIKEAFDEEEFLRRRRECANRKKA